MAMADLTISTPDLLTFAEAAELLGISRPTVYNMVSRYQLHPVLIGKNRYLMRSEVEGINNAKRETSV